MYVQSCASTGGEAILSPSATVYNEIAATRPDLIKVLSDPIWTYDKYVPPSDPFSKTQSFIPVNRTTHWS
jgi:hypothetical protein